METRGSEEKKEKKKEKRKEGKEKKRKERKYITRASGGSGRRRVSHFAFLHWHTEYFSAV